MGVLGRGVHLGGRARLGSRLHPPRGSRPARSSRVARGADLSRVPVTGINELVLEVADLEEAARFYTKVLGFPVQGRSENRVWVLAGEGTRIGLWAPQVGIAGGQGGAHVHYALHVDEADYDAAVVTLRERGYDPHEEDFEESGRAAYVTDPDGNVVELWTWGG